MYRNCITVSSANCPRTWQGDMAETPKRAMTASRDKKRRPLKAQGTGGSQFDYPMEVSTPHTAFFTFIALLFQPILNLLLSFVDITSSYSACLNQLYQQKFLITPHHTKQLLGHMIQLCFMFLHVLNYIMNFIICANI